MSRVCVRLSLLVLAVTLLLLTLGLKLVDRRLGDFIWRDDGQEAFKEDNSLSRPGDYSPSGCPTVPIVFSGMTGWLGNIMSTYVNLIALEWTLGYKLFLPFNMSRGNPLPEETLPYLKSVFRNVTFPVATWRHHPRAAVDAREDAVLLFNNSGTGGRWQECPNMTITKIANVAEAFNSKASLSSKWVRYATGANYPDMAHIGPLLPELVARHLQFLPEIEQAARGVVDGVAARHGRPTDLYVGVHVRRAGYAEFVRWWMTHEGRGDGKFVDETFFKAGMEYFKKSHPDAVFLVLSDDMDWCRQHLSLPSTYLVGGVSAEVDMAVMGQCNASILDYGTYGMWGAILAGGETVVSKRTFRDNRWAADYLGWTYL